DPSDAAIARMQDYLPGTYLMKLDASSGIPGIQEEVYVNAYDYTFFAGADTPEQMVDDATKAVWEQAASLRESSPIWRQFDEAVMGKAQAVEYHPGAIRFYQEIGIWPDAEGTDEASAEDGADTGDAADASTDAAPSEEG
ncbi:MAG: TAXI family TRAP transporter solute-binding subunit, partial [Acidobacteriota bacterium]